MAWYKKSTTRTKGRPISWERVSAVGVEVSACDTSLEVDFWCWSCGFEKRRKFVKLKISTDYCHKNIRKIGTFRKKLRNIVFLIWFTWITALIFTMFFLYASFMCTSDAIQLMDWWIIVNSKSTSWSFGLAWYVRRDRKWQNHFW